VLVPSGPLREIFILIRLIPADRYFSRDAMHNAKCLSNEYSGVVTKRLKLCNRIGLLSHKIVEHNRFFVRT